MARFRINLDEEPKPESPVLLFRDLRRQPLIKFLWGHQEKLLDQYYGKHLDTRDLAIELPTGSGKTLVGLLIGEFRRRARGERVVFLCPNRQLCTQVESQARKYGIPTALLIGKQNLYDPAVFSKYQEAKAIAITTYSGVFNTNPKIDDPEIILCDDAHAGDGFIASLWSLRISRKDHPKIYTALLAALRDVIPTGLLHVIDSYEGNPRAKSLVDMISPISIAGSNEAMKEALQSVIEETDLKYSWSLILDKLEACQFYASSNAFEVRPIVPPTLTHQPFAGANQRVYMSATLGENGDIERSFGVKKIARIPLPEGWDKRGTGRRLILFPDKSGTFSLGAFHSLISLIERCLVLVPNEVSRESALGLFPEDYAIMGPKEIENDLRAFTQAADTALLLANRYDGIDLPGSDCRMLVILSVPTGIMTVGQKTWRGSERPTVGQKTGRPWLHSWPRDHDGGLTHHPGPCAVRSMGVHRHGELGRDPPSRPRRRPQQARRLPRLRPPLGHAHQDPRALRATRLSSDGAPAQAEARPLPGRHP
jgi:hypothetical protein